MIVRSNNIEKLPLLEFQWNVISISGIRQPIKSEMKSVSLTLTSTQDQFKLLSAASRLAAMTTAIVH